MKAERMHVRTRTLFLDRMNQHYKITPSHQKGLADFQWTLDVRGGWGQLGVRQRRARRLGVRQRRARQLGVRQRRARRLGWGVRKKRLRAAGGSSETEWRELPSEPHLPVTGGDRAGPADAKRLVWVASSRSLSSAPPISPGVQPPSSSAPLDPRASSRPRRSAIPF